MKHNVVYAFLVVALVGCSSAPRFQSVPQSEGRIALDTQTGQLCSTMPDRTLEEIQQDQQMRKQLDDSDKDLESYRKRILTILACKH
jgi:hypothetical protein